MGKVLSIQQGKHRGSRKASAKPMPKRIVRIGDVTLRQAAKELEAELGTIEAYNRLVECAHQLRERINESDVRPPRVAFSGGANERSSGKPAEEQLGFAFGAPKADS